MASTKRDLQKEFHKACERGNLKALKEIIALEASSRSAHTSGKLPTLCFLFEQINIHAGDELAFRNACRLGQLPIVEYLLSLEENHGKIDIHVDGDLAFRSACEQGHVTIVDLLLRLEPTHGKIDIHTSNEYAMGFACWCGHHTVAARLISLQHTHGEIAPNRLKAIAATTTECFAVAEIENALENHSFEEAQRCIQPVVNALDDAKLRHELKRILAAKARMWLTERSEPTVTHSR